jgi:hypothetical protein
MIPWVHVSRKKGVLHLKCDVEHVEVVGNDAWHKLTIDPSLLISTPTTLELKKVVSCTTTHYARFNKMLVWNDVNGNYFPLNLLCFDDNTT